MGPPALTKPMTGIPSSLSTIEIPLEAPETILRTPFLLRAFRWSSAALGDLNPKTLAISDLVVLQPENWNYSNIEVNPKTEDLSFEGTCVGLLRDFS